MKQDAMQQPMGQCSQQGRGGRRAALRHGTSLIEILVVLVILVFGILSILRIFPGGFLAVRSAENSTYADRLAQAELESLKGNTGGLPDGIYVPDLDTTGNLRLDTNGNVRLDPNWFPDDLGPYPANSANPLSSDINKARYISNETITVPASRAYKDAMGANQFGSLYTVNFGPILMDPTQLTTENTDQFNAYLKVDGVPWAARTGDSRLVLTQPVATDTTGTAVAPTETVDVPQEELAAGQPSYLVDYGAGKIAVAAAPYDQYFSLTLQQAVTGGSGTVALTSYLVRFHLTTSTGTNPYQGGWFRISDGTSANASAGITIDNITNLTTNASVTSLPANVASVGSGSGSTNWVIGTTVLTRPFRNVNPSGTANPATPFDADPYEYYLVSTTDIGGATQGDGRANAGVIAFNPLASGRNGLTPLQARLSYTTYDWHVLHEDHDLTDADGANIRLTLTNLKKVGDVQNDNTLFAGLFGGGGTTNVTSYDVVILDMDTGQTVGLSDTDTTNVFDIDTANGNAADTQFQVSYRNGRVIFPTNFANFPAFRSAAPKHIRVFYAGDADWAVAVQKAATVYQRVAPTAGQSSTAADSTTALTTIGPVLNQYALDPVNKTIFFPKCDAGKTVELDNITYYVLQSNGSSTVQRHIPAQTLQLPDAVNGNGVLQVTLDLPLQTGETLSSNYGLTIGAVRGTSARAVVIYKERSQWKTRDVDTLLTASPATSTIQ